jgi:HlyD family secretion protein
MLGQTMVEVTTGLEEGQEIVTGPFKALREIKDGDKVRREEEKKKGEKESES